MTPALVALAILVAAGGVAAVSARQPRLAALGVIVAIVGAPYIADPLPSVLALGTRLVAGVLAGYLLWVALRRAPVLTAGWGMGWPGSAAIALFAFVAGWLAGDAAAGALNAIGGAGPAPVGVATSLAGGSLVARAALGTAVALGTLAIAPVVLARDVLRLGIGLLLLVATGGLVASAIWQPGDDGSQLALAILTLACGAAVAVLAARSLATYEDFELHLPTERSAPFRGRSADDAHPLDRRG